MNMLMAYEGGEKYRKRVSHLKYLNTLGDGKYKLKIITDRFLDCKVAVFYKASK